MEQAIKDKTEEVERQMEEEQNNAGFNAEEYHDEEEKDNSDSDFADDDEIMQSLREQRINDMKEAKKEERWRRGEGGIPKTKRGRSAPSWLNESLRTIKRNMQQSVLNEHNIEHHNALSHGAQWTHDCTASIENNPVLSFAFSLSRSDIICNSLRMTGASILILRWHHIRRLKIDRAKRR